MKRDLLDGITIVDLSHRLPGPLAGHLLAGLGAKVIKIEDKNFKDPFVTEAFGAMDDSFKEWYAELNRKKEIIRYDFNNNEDQKTIRDTVFAADGIIMGLPPKWQNKFGIDQEALSASTRPLAVIQLLASFSHKEALHDLNALAISGLLKLFINDKKDHDIIPPPFMPIAGISFGQKVATDLLAALIHAGRIGKPVFTKSYLYEATEEIFTPFWPKPLREREFEFLHNGRYPCYNIYRLNDGEYVALAAVEEKFWNRLCLVLGLDLTPNDRFDCDGKVFVALAKKFAGMSSLEVQNLLVSEDICVSLV